MSEEYMNTAHVEGLPIDPKSGKQIRLTDNTLKEGDLKASQSTKPLVLDKRGLPEGWEVPDGNS